MDDLAARAMLWFQKWRWYERNTLPWRRARLDWELLRREAYARRPLHGNVLEALLDGRLEVGANAFFEPDVWITLSDDARISIGEGTFLNIAVMVAAMDRVEIGAHCMLANGCFVTDANHRFDDPDTPDHLAGLREQGPDEDRRQRLARRQRRRHQRRDDRRALRDRRQQRRHAGHPAVLDRCGRAGQGAACRHLRRRQQPLSGRTQPPKRPRSAITLST